MKSQYRTLLIASLTAFSFTLGVLPCHSLVIYNLPNDNADITSDPNNGSPWEAVGRISENGSTRGSAVYLGNRYLLTADHIYPNSTRTVQFTPGGTNYQISDAFTPQQVAPGLDLKVFRITSDPGISGVSLFNGTNEQGKNATIVGWGFGRANESDVGTTSQSWGSVSTSTKRWGTNLITDNSSSLSYTLGGKNFSYQSIEYTLGDNQGDTEAGAASWDSGGAIFIQDNSNWYLGGIMAVVSTNGSSTFDSIGRNESGDVNAGPRISAYISDIEAAVPELSSTALALSMATFIALIMSRRHSWKPARC